MEFKRSKSNKAFSIIERFIFFVFLLIQYNFFLLYYVPKVAGGINSRLLFIAIPLILVMLMNGIKIKNYKFASLILTLLFMVFISAIWSCIQYFENTIDILTSVIPWISLLMYFPLSDFIRREKKFFLRLLTIMNIICCLVFIYQSIRFQESSFFLNDNYFISESGYFYIPLRGNSIRILMNWQIIIASLLISISELLKRRSLKVISLDFINFISGTICIFSVIQTRTLLIIYIISLLFATLLVIKKNIKMRTIIIIMATILCVFVTYFFSGLSKWVSSFFSTFSDSEYASSNSIREGAVLHFLDIIKTNPFLGNGFYLGNPGTTSYLRAKGLLGLYYYSDLGMIGNLAQYGILALISFLIYLKKSLSVIRSSKKTYISIFIIFYSISFLTTLSWIYYLSILPFIITLSYIDSEINYGDDIEYEH